MHFTPCFFRRYKIALGISLMCLIGLNAIISVVEKDPKGEVTIDLQLTGQYNSEHWPKQDDQYKHGRNVTLEQRELKKQRESQFHHRIDHRQSFMVNRGNVGQRLQDKIANKKIGKRVMNQTKHRITKESHEPIVLLWNKFYGGDFDAIGKDGMRHVCPQIHCIFTHDKSLLTQADAVVFHMWPEDRWDFPKSRTANQRYVFLLNESPVRRDYHFEWYNHFFNLTMTFRLDSDIPILYGNKYPRQSPVAVYAPWWLSEMAVMKAKRKSVAWVVSHCRTDSKREEYVEELKKYIDIDIYGHCGNLQCLPPRSQKCYNLIRTNYRFVLAFENSICRDYVTEKVYEMMANGVVPVVFGGANYSKILPPHSFINVADFKSPKHLAQYLLSLMHSDADYLRYYQWKRSFVLTTGNHEWQRAFCRLCNVLHYPSNHHKSYSIEDLNNHWGPWNCDSNYLKAMKDKW